MCRRETRSLARSCGSVGIELVDPADDRGVYTIEFANDLASPLALQDAASATAVPLQDMPVRLSTAQVGAYYLANLTDAQISTVTSTTVTVDVGFAPAVGNGIEVRAHDFGWGASNDRNLLGRFITEVFTLPRLARTQNYFMRMYDGSSPPRYSRYSAALHVDYPCRMTTIWKSRNLQASAGDCTPPRTFSLKF